MKRLMCALVALLMLAALAGCKESADGRSEISNPVKSVNDVLNEGIKQNDPAPQSGESSSGKTGSQSGERPSGKTDGDNYDVDLTTLSSTMVYSEVSHMMSSPDDYLGKTVKMSGTFVCGKGDGRYYFACLIADATACCAQGIEFVLKDERVFPDEYPAINDEITVTGVFDTYYEGNIRYCQLIDACLL